MATKPVPVQASVGTELPRDDTVDLYLRKSNKDKLRSVERQRADLTEGAEQEGLRIGRVFIDPDFSASRYRRRDRPDFAQLVEHVRDGDCRILGIAEVSRGSRELTEWSAFLDLCRSRGVRIWVSTHERIYDLSRRRDWRALADEGLDAADESEKISERVRSGQRKAARAGKPHGKLKYGFTRIYDERGNFVRQEAHPAQAPIVREMIKRIAAGEALRVIARDLNARGIPMATGGQWTGSHVRQMIVKGEAFIGRRVHQGVDIGPASWDPIVDVDQWRQAVAVLTRPERRSTSRGPELVHWLANTVVCGTCETTTLIARLKHAPPSQPRPTYTCEGCWMVVSARALEQLVEDLLLERLSQPDAAMALARHRPDDVAVAAAKQAVDDLNDELAQWRDLARMKKVSPVSFAMFEADLLPKIERAEKTWQRLAVPAEHADLDLTDVPSRWPDMPPELKRRYVRAFLVLVVDRATTLGCRFDDSRLDRSRWAGDERTWGEIRRG
jgi:site-specific DNA recombinase